MGQSPPQYYTEVQLPTPAGASLLTQPVAEELDAAIWRLFECTVVFTVPRDGGQRGLVLQVPEVPALDSKTYQECVVRTLVRLCGWGLRSLKDTFGEVTDPWHQLLAALATSRVQVAGVQRGRRGLLRSEDAEFAVAISSLRVRLGVATVKAQCTSMLGRLDVMGPGAGAARGRRRQAATLERCWGLEQRSAELARRQGWRAQRSGYAKLD